MLVHELEGVLNAHAFLQVERPPELWGMAVEVEAFLRVLGELIAAGLVRNGQELSELTLNVSNVVVEPSAAGSVPEVEFVALTIRSRGDWSPEATWQPSPDIPRALVNLDLAAALTAADAACAYTRVLREGEGSVTVFFRRAG